MIGGDIMKKIKTITDKEILGTDGWSTAKPRLTARAILKNRHDQIAVMYAKKYDLYSLPGGGVEAGEKITDALKREIYEETGCECNIVEPLGYVEENRAHCDYTQISYYFLVTTNSETLHPSLTEDEAQNGTVVGWHSIEDAYQCIAAPRHTTNQRKYLQARDVAALNEYLKKG